MERAAAGGVEMTPPPRVGRVFEHTGRPVRLADVSPKGRFRLDAVARYLQDVADDDARDAAPGDGNTGTAWVVRRTRIEVRVWPSFGERLDLVTWCSGTGARWAERRTSMHGDRGGDIETVSLWVHVDLDSGAPARLTDPFARAYAPAARGRRVRATLLHDAPPAAAQRRAWALRFTDFDVMGHVNNAAYWQVVEEVMAGVRRRASGGRALARSAPPDPDDHGPAAPVVSWGEVEYRDGVVVGDEVMLASITDEASAAIWFEVGGRVRASARAGAGQGQAWDCRSPGHGDRG